MKQAYGLAIPETLREAVDPKTTALIVYDMQVGILRQLPQGVAILAQVLRLVALARATDLRIYFTRHLSLPKKLAGVFQLRQMLAWQRLSSVEEAKPWFLRDSPGFALAPELTPREDEAIIDKITMSAFEGTPLAIALRDVGAKSFIVCGVATEIGIDPTVRHGADLGLIPVVVEDACAAGHEEAGARSLANMRFMGDAMLCSIADLAAAWK
jgi:nicotinamidase-related amidase